MYLMQILSKETSQTWSKHEKAFGLKTQPNSRRTIEIKNFTDRESILKNNRYLKYSFDIHIYGVKHFEEFIKTIDLIENIFDLQIVDLKLSSHRDEDYSYLQQTFSKLFHDLMGVLQAKVPEFNFPITFIDERFERNKNSVFHILNLKVFKSQDEYIFRFDTFSPALIMSEASFKDSFDFENNLSDSFHIYENNAKYFFELKMLNRSFQSDAIHDLHFICSDFDVENHPVKVLKLITEQVFTKENEPGKFPLLDFKDISMYAENMTVDNLKVALEVSDFKDDFNRSIEESKEISNSRVLQNVCMSFGNIGAVDNYCMHFIQENNYVYINADDQTF
jgi:hypothetical protein